MSLSSCSLLPSPLFLSLFLTSLLRYPMCSLSVCLSLSLFISHMNFKPWGAGGLGVSNSETRRETVFAWTSPLYACIEYEDPNADTSVCSSTCKRVCVSRERQRQCLLSVHQSAWYCWLCLICSSRSQRAAVIGPHICLLQFDWPVSCNSAKGSCHSVVAVSLTLLLL